MSDRFRPLTHYRDQFEAEPTARQCVGGPLDGLWHPVLDGESVVVLERERDGVIEYSSIRLRPGSKRRIAKNGGQQIGTYHPIHGRLRWAQHKPKP